MNFPEENLEDKLKLHSGVPLLVIGEKGYFRTETNQKILSPGKRKTHKLESSVPWSMNMIFLHFGFS